jgi:hypothetical protein
VLSLLAVREDLAARRLVRIKVEGLDLRRELRRGLARRAHPRRTRARAGPHRGSPALTGRSGRSGPAVIAAEPDPAMRADSIGELKRLTAQG